MDRILKIRDLAVEAGYTNNAGSRHAKAAEHSIRASGRNYELTFYPKSVGLFNVKELVPNIPIGLKLVRKAGSHFVLPHKAEKSQRIRRIAEKLNRQEPEE